MKPSPEIFRTFILGSLFAWGLTRWITTFALSKTTGSPTLWGLGSGLGGLAKRHGGQPVHLFSASRRLGMPPVTGELTYGLERIAMYLQASNRSTTSFGQKPPPGRDLWRCLSPERSRDVDLITFVRPMSINCSHSSNSMSRRRCRLAEKKLPLPAYEYVMKASHTFNLLDARHAIGVTERQRYILRVRTLARATAEAYVAARGALGFPMADPDLRRFRIGAAWTQQGEAVRMSTEDLLFELGTEELPAGEISGMAAALVDTVTRDLSTVLSALLPVWNSFRPPGAWRVWYGDVAVQCGRYRNDTLLARALSTARR